jgi:radical SAM superfamily enzyme YgiQ (UPF0313 family)
MPKPAYREKDPALLVQDIKTLVRKYKARHLLISNPVISPRQVLQISKNIIEQKIRVSWDCLARLDKGFNKDLLRLAKRSGCRAIDFGLESANERVLNLMRKGNDICGAARIIRDCHDAGIETYIQVMVGFPTETVEEALETIGFLFEQRKYFKAAVFNIYHLMPHNFIYTKPERFAIEYKKDPAVPFRFFHRFRHLERTAIGKREAERLIGLARRLGIRVVSWPSRAKEN